MSVGDDAAVAVGAVVVVGTTGLEGVAESEPPPQPAATNNTATNAPPRPIHLVWHHPRERGAATDSEGHAMAGPTTNEHGVEATARRIFSWREVDGVRFDDDGVEAQILSGENMHLIRAVYPPGTPYEMHSHPHEQFSLLLSGRLLLTVGEETREIGPGDGWYAPGDVPHGGEVLWGEAAVFIDVYSPATAWILSVFAEARPVPAAG